MNLILITIISLLVSAGVYLVLSKDLLRTIIGLAILGTAANLVMFYAGQPNSMTSAIIDQGLSALSADAANPLPQALVLTAIVIGFALLCFALVLMVVIAQQTNTRNSDSLTHNEPKPNPAIDPLKPTQMDFE
ncbi:MAG: NADH-quinone oxidoreductase subunit K [Thiotrichales bacterium]|nr:NADH-quinone oxidoreductase subunit K [Thiotrichales bacterium]